MSDEVMDVGESNAGGEGRKSRRDLLKAAGVVAGAAVAGKLASAESASAADGQPLVVAANNSASNIETGLTTAGIAAPTGFKAFKVTAPNFDYGVSGEAKDYGVVGTGAGGVLGLGTVGGVFSGSVVAINLDPQNSPGAPTGEAFKGDLAVDSTGVLWLCVADGTPGTWIRVSHGGTRFLSSPVRAYDSRFSSQGKLRAGAGDTANPRTIPIAGVVAGVPNSPMPIGVIGNITVTQEDAPGFATIWPGGAWPGTSNINYTANFDIANSFSVGLGAGGTVSVASFAPTHVIVDIAGYIL